MGGTPCRSRGFQGELIVPRIPFLGCDEANDSVTDWQCLAITQLLTVAVGSGLN